MVLGSNPAMSTKHVTCVLHGCWMKKSRLSLCSLVDANAMLCHGTWWSRYYSMAIWSRVISTRYGQNLNVHNAIYHSVTNLLFVVDCIFFMCGMKKVICLDSCYPFQFLNLVVIVSKYEHSSAAQSGGTAGVCCSRCHGAVPPGKKPTFVELSRTWKLVCVWWNVLLKKVVLISAVQASRHSCVFKLRYISCVCFVYCVCLLQVCWFNATICSSIGILFAAFLSGLKEKVTVSFTSSFVKGGNVSIAKYCCSSPACSIALHLGMVIHCQR